MPKKKIALVAAAIGIIAAVTVVNRKPEPAPPAAPASAAVAAKPINHQQAMDSLMALPELKAWSATIEKQSNGKARGALIEYDPKPASIEGRNYWQISYVENGADATHRWEDFLISVDNGEILIMDFATEKPISLEQWRKERHPMDRTSNQATGG